MCGSSNSNYTRKWNYIEGTQPWSRFIKVFIVRSYIETSVGNQKMKMQNKESKCHKNRNNTGPLQYTQGRSSLFPKSNSTIKLPIYIWKRYWIDTNTSKGEKIRDNNGYKWEGIMSITWILSRLITHTKMGNIIWSRLQLPSLQKGLVNTAGKWTVGNQNAEKQGGNSICLLENSYKYPVLYLVQVAGTLSK